MKWKIDVTDADITQGRRCSASSCPVAKAIRRVTGFGDVVIFRRVYLTGLSYYLTGWSSYEGTTPSVAIDWIKRFDNSFEVEPFSFWLELERKR